MPQPPEPRFLDDRPAYWAEHTPDNEAISYLGRSWTWAQWYDRIRRCAGALAERGIGRGDVVGFLDKNHPACVETTVAAASLGAATAIINFRLAGDEIDYVLNDSGAKLLIVGAEFVGGIEKIRDRLTHVEHVIDVTPDGADGDEYEAMLAAATPRGRSPEVTPDDVCVIMYSSGTTGNPKGIRLTQANLIAHTVNAGTFEFERRRQEHGGDAAVPCGWLVLRAVRHPRRNPQRHDPRGRRRVAGRCAAGRAPPAPSWCPRCWAR